MNRTISQGHAIRSILGRSPVIHCMATAFAMFPAALLDAGRGVRDRRGAHDSAPQPNTDATHRAPAAPSLACMPPFSR
jgi:hypothetical protein